MLIQGNKFIIYRFIHVYFKSGLAANECHESSKSTTKLVDILSVYLSCKGYYLVFFCTINWSFVVQKYLSISVQNTVLGHFHDCFSLVLSGW